MADTTRAAGASWLGGFLLLAASAGCGSGDCEVVLAEPLMVISVAPSHGSVNVDLDTIVVVAFSDRIVSQANAADAITLRDVDTVVPTTVSLSTDGQVVTVTPDDPPGLESRVEYTIAIASRLEGTETGPLGVDLSYTFTTR